VVASGAIVGAGAVVGSGAIVGAGAVVGAAAGAVVGWAAGAVVGAVVAAGAPHAARIIERAIRTVTIVQLVFLNIFHSFVNIHNL